MVSSNKHKLKKMQCSACKEINYRTTRRVKGDNIEKLRLRKFCKRCGTQTEHKEMKK